MRIVWPRRLPPEYGGEAFAMGFGESVSVAVAKHTVPVPLWESGAALNYGVRWWILRLPFGWRLNVTVYRK